MANLNYKHLHYFWVVAHEGSMTRAAERLGVAVQTISGQLSLLERNLGRALFVSQGRGLALSDAGRAALGIADQIFQLGEALEEALDNVTVFYNREVLDSIENGLRVLEPLLTVILGLLLGGILVSVLLPVYDLIGNLPL